MIITAAPYRVSFFGGGTDYPEWYQENGGSVLGGTINRYCYISCRNFPPFFDFKHRIVWSKIENIREGEMISHPAVQKAIDFMGFSQGLEIHHNGDLPARSGLGSSSAFAVALLHAFHSLKGEMVGKRQLAQEAIHLERNLLQEVVGIQDQILTAYGGINHVSFDRSGDFNVESLIVNCGRKQILENNLLLFYTGIARFASKVASDHVAAINDKKTTLTEMANLVAVARDILTSGSDIDDFGRLLHETWMLKRSITPEITNSVVDDLYSKALSAGAIGGKLLGAGGGGFVLIYAPMEKHQAILETLSHYLAVPFKFELEGSKVVFYEPEVYSNRALNDRAFIR